MGCDSNRYRARPALFIVTRLLLALISLYRMTLSPLIGQRCRFHPSCSEYGRQSILQHGPWHGSWMTCKRLLRCQPLCEGGLDPVPEQRPGWLEFHRNRSHDTLDPEPCCPDEHPH